VLGRFRENLLAIYKGWVLRQRVLKAFKIKMIVREIKMLRNRSVQMGYI
jgi:hypothetical protein